jgi:hypothetical protein
MNDLDKLRLLRLLSLALCGFCLYGAGEAQTYNISDGDLPALFARMKASMAANGKLVEQYTSDEFYHNENFDKNGKVTSDETAKYENVFVEGLPYRRKVEVNGKPLNEKEAAAEEKRYEKAVSERRAMTMEQKRLSLHINWHSSLPICCLATLFENRIVRHESLVGRDLLVVESVPKAGTKPANTEDESSLNWKETTWIDTVDNLPARIDVELLNDKDHLVKGNTERIDFVRLLEPAMSAGRPEQAVWLQQHSIARFRFKALWIDVTGTTEQTWSNFKKFHVDVRLLNDSMQPQ